MRGGRGVCSTEQRKSKKKMFDWDMNNGRIKEGREWRGGWEDKKSEEERRKKEERDELVKDE